MRVLAAMSGGVDSAVAAARVLEAGHEVVGVHLALSRKPATERTSARGCCTIEDAGDARRVADRLDIPFYVWDMAERFAQEVIEDFVAEYEAGRTPNPCLRCNEKIKFSALLDKALALGFDAVATGHYARLVEADGGVQLHRAVDSAKDQSYVLAVLTPGQLAHALFPLGGSTKPEIRAEAAARGLRVADKPDSHDICFIPDGDTAGFLADRLGRRPGEIVDADGTTVGHHEGSYAFTVGQRRGLALGEPAPGGRRRYVVAIEPLSNTVRVGTAEALDVGEIAGERATWCGTAPSVGARVGVQVRAHGEEVPAEVVDVAPDDDGAPSRVRVRLAAAVRGIAPGQALVLYEGTQVIGSATITSARS